MAVNFAVFLATGATAVVAFSVPRAGKIQDAARECGGGTLDRGCILISGLHFCRSAPPVPRGSDQKKNSHRQSLASGCQ